MTRKGTIEKGSRTALVTGAGSGIGRCMARRLAELGYRLILAGLDPAKLEAAAEELHEQYGLAVEVIPIDLARPEAAHELFERVQALGREVDVLVNNAGAFSFRDILQTPVERIERILCLHALTTTLTCRLFGAEMSRRGCGGHILNMASYSLWMPWPGTGAIQRQQILPAWFFGSFRQGGARTEHPCHGRLPGRCGHRPLRTAAPLAAHRTAARCAHHAGQLCPASLESPLARTPLLRARLVEPAFHTLLPSDANVRTPGCSQVHDEASTLKHRTR